MYAAKPRVMLVLQYFPQLSQTYIKAEIEALCEDYELSVVTMKAPDLPYKNHYPYRMIPAYDKVREAIREFQPTVLHTHYLETAEVVGKLARDTGIPFTVRAHSFDTLMGKTTGKIPRHIKAAMSHVNSDLCLGILNFPFTRPWLEKTGIRGEKIFDCFPVIAYDKFHNREPNGDAVMNVGACLPKKRMEDFVQLGKLCPSKTFNLYSIGYKADSLAEYNAKMGSPVTIHTPIEPDDFPPIYKQHGWLVYTACPQLNTVGWPMAVAEAQASGLGVCVPNLRPDMHDYVGGAGFVYDNIEEVAKIISRPYPQEMRELGFEQAKKSDIQQHKGILTDLWDKAQHMPRLDRAHSGSGLGSVFGSIFSRFQKQRTGASC